MIAGLALALLVLPLLGILLSAPWPQLPALLVAPETLQALGLSLLTGVISTACCLLLGIPLAAVLARSVAWPVVPRRLLRAAVTVPLVLPPVVGGLALLLLLGRNGILGKHLADVGITLPFTTGAVVIAQTFVAMPFLVFAVEGALRGADRRVELAAASLGATPFQVFRTVTVPLVAPGIAAGAVLCFARALGEFGALEGDGEVLIFVAEAHRAVADLHHAHFHRRAAFGHADEFAFAVSAGVDDGEGGIAEHDARHGEGVFVELRFRHLFRDFGRSLMRALHPADRPKGRAAIRGQREGGFFLKVEFAGIGLGRVGASEKGGGGGDGEDGAGGGVHCFTRLLTVIRTCWDSTSSPLVST